MITFAEHVKIKIVGKVENVRMGALMAITGQTVTEIALQSVKMESVSGILVNVMHVMMDFMV